MSYITGWKLGPTPIYYFHRTSMGAAIFHREHCQQVAKTLEPMELDDGTKAHNMEFIQEENTEELLIIDAENLGPQL